MVVSVGADLKRVHNQFQAGGLKLVNSDFAFEIKGFEGLWLSTKQCPWPEYTPGGEIEVAAPGGSSVWQPQQAKAAQQGPISFFENDAGEVDDTMLKLLTSGQDVRFDAKVYQGISPESYAFYKPIYGCFIVLDTPDRDWENRSQPLTFNGTLFYHYYGEKVKAA